MILALQAYKPSRPSDYSGMIDKIRQSLHLSIHSRALLAVRLCSLSALHACPVCCAAAPQAEVVARAKGDSVFAAFNPTKASSTNVMANLVRDSSR